MRKAYGWLGFLLLVAAVGCQDSIVLVDLSGPAEPASDERDVDRDPATGEVFITDRTGRRWDLTHAVKHYGFVPEDFQFGLGKDAIKPILSPEMLCPGDASYPPASRGGLVIGVNLDEPPRAYPIEIMSSYEVANEEIEGEFVAVAY